MDMPHKNKKRLDKFRTTKEELAIETDDKTILSSGARELEQFMKNSSGTESPYLIFYQKWLSLLKKDNGEPDMQCITMLALIILWTRPTYDGSNQESTGNKIPTRKTEFLYPYFSISDLMEKMDTNRNQVKRCLKKLLNTGVISQHFKTVRRSRKRKQPTHDKRMLVIDVDALKEMSIFSNTEQSEITNKRKRQRIRDRGKNIPKEYGAYYDNAKKINAKKAYKTISDEPKMEVANKANNKGEGGSDSNPPSKCNDHGTQGGRTPTPYRDHYKKLNTLYLYKRFLQNADERSVGTYSGGDDSPTSPVEPSTRHCMADGNETNRNNSSSQSDAPTSNPKSAKSRKRKRTRNVHPEPQHRPGDAIRGSGGADVVPEGSGAAQAKFERKSLGEKRKEKMEGRKNSPSQKKKGSALYQNRPNLLLIEWWNQQPNLRSHRTNTKIYSDCLRKLQHLRNGKLSQIISMDSLDEQQIPHDWYSKKWKTKDIKKAINTLQEWTKEGNFPANKDWLKKMSLSDVIYNPRTGRSVLMQAFKFGVKPLYDPSKELSQMELREFNDMKEFLSKYQTRKLNGQFDKQIAELMKDLSGLREKNKYAWERLAHTPVGAGNLSGLVCDYMEYLEGSVYPESLRVSLRENVTPKALMRGSYLWKQFVKAFSTYFNVDPIEGQFLN